MAAATKTAPAATAPCYVGSRPQLKSHSQDHRLLLLLCRSAIPVVTCVLAVVVESRWPSKQEAIALITLTSGVMLAVWQGTVTGKPYAIIFCITGTVCNGG